MPDEQRLRAERNIWMATTRPDGRPHLVPIWFVWHAGDFYVMTGERSVKARNLAARPHVSVSLEDGDRPVVAECRAEIVPRPLPAEVVEAFRAKYAWEIETDQDYSALYRLAPLRWLMDGAP